MATLTLTGSAKGNSAFTKTFVTVADGPLDAEITSTAKTTYAWWVMAASGAGTYCGSSEQTGTGSGYVDSLAAGTYVVYAWPAKGTASFTVTLTGSFG